MRRAAALAPRLALALGIFLVLGEIAARSTGVVDRINPFPRRLYVGTGVADLPYRLRPGVTVEVRGSRVVVNELGMRDRPGVEPRPAPGTERVLVVGDSVAFGWLQDVENTFPRRLQGRLDAAAPGRFEVLNGGVPGYNAVSEAAWLREHGLALAPRTVVVAVNLNDFDATPHVNGLGVLSTADDRVSPLSPAHWSELYLALRWAALALGGDPRVQLGGATGQGQGEGQKREAVPGPAQGRAPAAEAPPGPGMWDRFDTYVSNLRKRFYREPTEPLWGEMRAAWADLARRTREHGIRLVFALFPDGDQIGAAAPDWTPQRRLLELCAEQGLECIDLAPAFAASPAGTRLFADIMHPSDAGHAIAADAIAPRLLGQPPAVSGAPG